MNSDILRIAARVVWWKSPEEVVAREHDFLCRVMALSSAPAGVFDNRSWHYWHHRLGIWAVGALPVRTFPQ